MFEKYPIYVNKEITEEEIKKAERLLMDNGIDEDDAYTILQAVGYVLLDVEFYPEEY